MKITLGPMRWTKITLMKNPTSAPIAPLKIHKLCMFAAREGCLMQSCATQASTVSHPLLPPQHFPLLMTIRPKQDVTFCAMTTKAWRSPREKPELTWKELFYERTVLISCVQDISYEQTVSKKMKCVLKKLQQLYYPYIWTHYKCHKL